MVDDWIAHTPKAVLAKNFGVNASFFDNVPTPDPYYVNGTVSAGAVNGAPAGAQMAGNASFVYRTMQHAPDRTPGGGGQAWKIDSSNFPISKTIAATFVRLKPGGLRELHWHPNASPPLAQTTLETWHSNSDKQGEEWLYFHQGTGRATVFIGGATARTFDFSAGDTAAFPDNAG